MNKFTLAILFSLISLNTYAQETSKFWNFIDNKEHPVWHINVSSYTYYEAYTKGDDIDPYGNVVTHKMYQPLDNPETTVSLVLGMALFGYNNISLNQNIHFINNVYGDLANGAEVSLSLNYTFEKLALYHMNLGVFTSFSDLLLGNGNYPWGVMIGYAF
jgi:hypothetical protein